MVIETAFAVAVVTSALLGIRLVRQNAYFRGREAVYVSTVKRLNARLRALLATEPDVPILITDEMVVADLEDREF